MFIVPISTNISPVQSLFDKNSVKTSENEGNGAAFSDVFKEVYNEVQETQRVVEEDNIKIMLGEIDDLHTIYNNMTKSELAVETFVAVTNAATESYNKMLQMTL